MFGNLQSLRKTQSSMKIAIYFIESTMNLNIHFGNTWIISRNSWKFTLPLWFRWIETITRSFNFTNEEFVRSFIQQRWTFCTWIESSEWYMNKRMRMWMKSISLCECAVHELQLMTIITYFWLFYLCIPNKGLTLNRQ